MVRDGGIFAFISSENLPNEEKADVPWTYMLTNIPRGGYKWANFPQKVWYIGNTKKI